MLGALRKLAENDVQDCLDDSFDKDGKASCAICGAPLERGEGHVDHKKTFKQLVEDWADEVGIDLEKLTTTPCGVGRTLTDEKLAKSWCSYHKKHAQLRLVHVKCNISREYRRQLQLKQSKKK